MSCASSVLDPESLAHLSNSWLVLQPAFKTKTQERCGGVVLENAGHAERVMAYTLRPPRDPFDLSLDYPTPIDATSSGWELNLPDTSPTLPLVPDVDLCDTDDSDFFFSLFPRTSVEEVECLLPSTSPDQVGAGGGLFGVRGRAIASGSYGLIAPHTSTTTLLDDVEVDLKMTGLFPLGFDEHCADDDSCEGGGTAGGGGGGGGRGRVARGKAESGRAAAAAHTSFSASPEMAPRETNVTRSAEELTDLTELVDLLEQERSVRMDEDEVDDRDDDDRRLNHHVNVDDAVHAIEPAGRRTAHPSALAPEGVYSKEMLKRHPGFAAVVRFLTAPNPHIFIEEAALVHPLALPSTKSGSGGAGGGVAAAGSHSLADTAATDVVFRAVHSVMRAMANAESQETVVRETEWHRVRDSFALALEVTITAALAWPPMPLHSLDRTCQHVLLTNAHTALATSLHHNTTLCAQMIAAHCRFTTMFVFQLPVVASLVLSLTRSLIHSLTHSLNSIHSLAHCLHFSSPTHSSSLTQAAVRKSTKRRATKSSDDDDSSESTDTEQNRGQKLHSDATRILREWVTVHVDNPYPNEDEKDELLLQTGLQITQINNWFINARRRLLKRLKKP
jgi:hypothetical protein